MKRTVLTILILAMAMTEIMAVPAYKGIITKTLPDGSSIDLQLHGDEFFSYVTTADGYLVKQMADSYYYYAEMNSGAVKSLGIRATNAGQRTADVQSMLAKKGRFELTAKQFRQLSRKSPMKRMAVGKSKKPSKVQSFERNLVILVSFSDNAFSYQQSDFNNLLNQQNYSSYGATGSVKDFFSDNSYGAFQPQFDVYGPYTLSHTEAYYGANTSSGSDTLPGQMVLDAVRMLDADITANVNFADYDNDGDNVIDNVFIIYAGHPESSGAPETTIWPHRWSVYPGVNAESGDWEDQTFDGVVLYDYGCSSELRYSSGNTICGIGAFCHEYSHLLGLMDLYVTDYSSDHKTVGYWDIMCSGCYNNDEHTPAGYSMFERFYLGWSTPTLLNNPATVSMASSMTANTSFVVTPTGAFNNDAEDPQPDVYYILENRQNTKWDTYLPGHGMLVEKISWDSYSWINNIGNNDPDNMVVDIIEAGNSTDVDGSDSDPFPGTNNVTSFIPYSVYPLTNISEDSGIITFDFMGGESKIYTVYFNAGRNGVADTLSLAQAEEGDTIILPSAVSLDSMDFVGWSYDLEAGKADAGVAGDLLVPTKNILLHAVYAINGQIIPNNYDGCFVEKFSKLGDIFGQDVTTTIDRYSDNKGWSGNKLTNNKGILQVGEEYLKGYIKTPATGFQGDFEVVAIVSQDAPAYMGLVSEDNMSSDYELAPKGLSVVYFDLSDVTPDSKLLFNSDNNTFGIMAVYICGEEIPEGVEDVVTERGAVLIRSLNDNGMARVENLAAGSLVRIIDALGRILKEDVADSEVYEFSVPNCFYLVQIINGNKIEVLK